MVLGGMLAEEDAFALIAERSRLMGEAADANPGVMSALLKITLPEAEALCAQCAEDEVARAREPERRRPDRHRRARRRR